MIILNHDIIQILKSKEWQIVLKIEERHVCGYWIVNHPSHQKAILQIVDLNQSDLAIRESIDLFKIEMQILAEIKHDGIVKILDLFEDETHQFWCMITEIVEAKSLADHLSSHRPLQYDQAWQLFKEITKILVVCQENGIIHRNLRSENIILKNENLVLINFEMAQAVHDSFDHPSDLPALLEIMAECFSPKHSKNDLDQVPKSIKDLIEPLLNDQSHLETANTLLASIILQEELSKIERLKYKQAKSFKANGVTFLMGYCPKGEFHMGKPKNPNDALDLEYDHRCPIRISHDFWMGETMVSQELWEAVMGWLTCEKDRRKDIHDPYLPVFDLTWYDCLIFCNRLSQLHHLQPCFSFSEVEIYQGKHVTSAIVEWHKDANGYRLPTSAEWEYAAKADTSFIYSGSNEIDEVAWYRHNAHQIQELKKKKANDWGLYDMSGNLWEWCMDRYDQRFKVPENQAYLENPVAWKNEDCRRVIRGGGSHNEAYDCSVYEISTSEAGDLESNVGFRLCKQVNPNSSKP